MPRIKHRDLTVEADRCARHQRFAMHHTGAVDGVARVKVIGAIKHYICSIHQNAQGLAFGAVGDRSNLHIRIDGSNCVANRGGFVLANVRHVMSNLALQIGRVNAVIVNHRKRAYTGAGKVQSNR